MIEAPEMSVSRHESSSVVDESAIPCEWQVLRRRVESLPPVARSRVEPVLDDAIEHAAFRKRTLDLACEAIERFRLERQILEFDLEATRRERAELRRRIEALGD